MKLKKMIVHGFKSFKDRTVIHFDEGITGIVGPNGCGKSNIVDALFWVMGEQSAKHLRGDNMKDVIFSGSAKYSPAAWAEVSLILDNSYGKQIHIGEKVYAPTEIQLTRRLYRNGESEYKINNLPARLKDIQEVFMDTGVGTKSYSIIAQGEINRLVQAGPQEKRIMIEEVAGITKFKLRKKESLKKMEQTRANLERLGDLKGEIGKNLKVLEQQAERALKARTLRERIKKSEIVVSAHDQYENLQFLKNWTTDLAGKQIEMETLKNEKNIADLQVEELKIKKEELGPSVEALQMEFNARSKELAGSEERLNYLQRSRSEKLKLVEQRGKENLELESELSERKQKLMVLEEQLEELELEESDDAQLQELEEKVEILKDEVEFKEQTVAELKVELERERERLRTLEQEQFRNSSRNEELTTRLEELLQSIETSEQEIEQKDSKSKQSDFGLQQIAQACEQREREAQELQVKAQALKRAIEERETRIQSLSKEKIQVESRLQSIQQLFAMQTQQTHSQENHLALSECLQDPILAARYQILSQAIGCEPQYERGLLLLLQQVMIALVDVGTGAQENLHQWLQNHPQAQGSLFMSSGDRTNPAIAIPGLIDCTQIMKIADPVLAERSQALLAGAYLMEPAQWELAHVEALMQAHPEIKAVATTDGQQMATTVLNGVLVHLNNTSGATQINYIALNNERAELDQRAESLAMQLEQLLSTQAQEQDQWKSCVQLSEESRNHLVEARTELRLKRTQLDHYRNDFEKQKAQLQELREKRNDLSKKRVAFIEREEELTEQIEELQGSSEKKVDALSELEESLAIKRDQYQNEKETLYARQAEVKSFDLRFKTLSSQIEDIRAQLEKGGVRYQSNAQLVIDYQTEIDQSQTVIELLLLGNKDLAELLAEKELLLNQQKSELHTLYASIEEIEKKNREYEKRINRLDREVVVLQAKMEQSLIEEEQCVRNIFEKYRINLRQSVGEALGYSQDEYARLYPIQDLFVEVTAQGSRAVEVEPFTFVKKSKSDFNEAKERLRELQRDFKDLGDINWSSIEEYDHQKKRFDFLNEQESVLKKSLEDLERAILHIDVKSKEKFRTAFEEVNERFQRVFPILFGGGSASLHLVGSFDDPEAGVDIEAQPPGKKMQNINLMSGGEKAMTAVSLIFSTFLVRPSPFCLLDEVDAPLDDANVTRFNELLREMSSETQFIVITHNKRTMELNDVLYGITMQEPGISKAVSVSLQ